MANIIYKHARITSLSLVFIFSMNSCTNDVFNENCYNQDSEISITGNTITTFSDKDTRSVSYNSLPEGCEISLFGNGGISAFGEILTLADGKWTGLENNKWNNDYENSEICAFYPKINDPGNINVQELLYSENNKLKDIIFCHKNLQRTNHISLDFKHLFSKICISIDSRINYTIKCVNLGIPYKISHLNTFNGDLEYEYTDQYNVSAEMNNEGIYEFIIPSGISMSLSLKLFGKDNNVIYSNNIEETTFGQGVLYNMNIKKSSDNGIYSNEDFIAFTNLINGIEYKGRKLFEFYKTENGRRIFKLYANINLTEEECRQIKQIGMINGIASQGFNDIFDGNGKKISGFTINTDDEMNYYSMFNTIGKDGLVKNLSVENIRFDITSVHKNMKFASVAGNNQGMIDNCKVDRISITGESTNPLIGGMVFENNGTIINSTIKDISIEGNTFTLGVLNFKNNHEILNCAVMTGVFKNSNSGKNSLMCVYNKGKVYNMFVKNVIDKRYLCTGYKNTDGIFINCYIPSAYYDAKNIKTPQIRIITFNYKWYIHYKALIDYLNEWIDNESKTLFPNYKFIKWKKMTEKEFENYK